MKGTLGRAQLAVILIGPAAAIANPGSPRSFETFGILLGAALVALAGTVPVRPPLPRTRSVNLALGGMVALSALAVLSIQWSGDLRLAQGAAVLDLLYAVAMTAAIPALRRRAAARMVEPAMALTAFAASAWGLSERILPRDIHLDNPRIALGRLSEPLGYWNAMGLLAGIGLVLTASLVADRTRNALTRTLAGLAVPTLAAALWMSYSRGALAASAAGLMALVALRPTRAQVSTVAVALFAGVAAAMTIERLPDLRTTWGSLRNRSHDALPFAIELGLATAVAGLLAVLIVRSSRQGRALAPALPRTSTLVATVAAFLLAAAPFVSVALGQRQSDTAGSGANAARLTSSESNRSAYWRVQFDRFLDEPVIGNGGGSFASAWSIHRGRLEPARNAHSLPLEVAGDYGLIGLGALALLIGGIVAAGRKSLRLEDATVAAPLAALVAFASHSLIDWDWQVPGLMLVVLVLACVPLATADGPAAGMATGRFRASRLAVALTMVLVASWAAWSIQSLRLEQRARSVSNAAAMLGWTDSRWDRVRRDLESASTLTPDSGPETRLAYAARAAGRQSQFLAISKRLVEDNPESWFAWQLLAMAAEKQDPKLSAEAHRRARELRPGLR